jgi:hypothetical protein
MICVPCIAHFHIRRHHQPSSLGRARPKQQQQQQQQQHMKSVFHQWVLQLTYLGLLQQH